MAGPSWWKYLSMVIFHTYTEDLGPQDKQLIVKIAQGWCTEMKPLNVVFT